MRNKLYFRIQRGMLLLLVITFLFPLALEVGYLHIYPLDFALFPMIGLWLLRGKRILNVCLGKVDIFLIFLLSIIFTSSLFAYRPGFAIDGGLLWLRGAIIFWFLHAHYGSVYDYSDIIVISSALLMFQGSLAIIQGVFQADVGALNQYFGKKIALRSYRVIAGKHLLRAQGTLGNPNTLASWIAVLIPVVVTSIPGTEQGRSRAVKISVVVIAFVGLLFTLSRGIILISVVSLLGLGLFLSDHFDWRHMGMIGLGITSVVLLLRDASLISPIGTKRIMLILLGFDLFAISPFIGVGYNNFSVSAAQLFNPSVYLGGTRSTVHNIPLLFLVETGVVGFVVFLLFVTYLFRTVAGYLAHTEGTDYVGFGYLTSLLVSFGIMQLYTTPVSFQFLPLLFVLYGVTIGRSWWEPISAASPG